MVLLRRVQLENTQITPIKNNSFLRQFGPAWLVMIADVDAGSIIGGAQTGAVFGYNLIWLYIVLVFPLFLVQELAGRISIATRKGLGSVIRENYGRNLSLLMTAPMALTDVITYAMEYIGIAVGLEIIGISIYYSIPVIYILHILVVTRKKYITAEKILILISLVLLVTFTATLLLRGILPTGANDSNPVYFHNSSTYLFLLAANVGAVVMPFMIFFQASATGVKARELGIDDNYPQKRKSVRIMRKETLLGAIVTEVLMIIIEMTFAGVSNAGSDRSFASAAQLSSILTPVAGKYSLYIFGMGLMAASFVALVVISLASAWGIAESLQLKKENVWILYVVESFPAMLAAMLIPSGLLVGITLYLLVFFVLVLLGPMLILGSIGSSRKIMGEFAFKRKYGILYYSTFTVILVTAIVSIIWGI